jgi:hypothetical protein
MVFVDEIILDGVTGSMPGKRDDLTDLIRRKKEKNDFDVLVLRRLDRLTRSGLNHGCWFEHECAKAGIQLLFVGDDIASGPYSSVIKALKYQSAQDQGFSISQRSTQGYQLALEEGRVSASSQTPYACWRLYRSADNQPLHIIRNLGDGRQEKLHPTTHVVMETYGHVGGGGKEHYRKQKSEKPLIMPAQGDDAGKVAVVREIFDLHFRQGFGGKRIADVLNRKAVPSPQGRKWSQRQVEVIYDNEVYTGINIANRTTSGIYHQRNHAAPKLTNLDPSVLANAKTIPPKVRPPSEWVHTDELLMHGFLGDETLRALAVEGQRKHWLHIADPDRPKMSKSKHKTSDYLLSGLLFAKQDGGGLVGVLCGRVGQKVRYYRHRRGRTGYLKGSHFNKLTHAETIENAVLDAVKTTLLDTPNLRQKLLARIAAESASNSTVDIDALKTEREQIRSRSQFLAMSLDAETLADAQPELDRMKLRRRELDAQITAAESSRQMPTTDAESMVERVLETIENFLGEFDSLPKHLLKEWLAALVSKVVVDMETKAIEIHVAFSAATLKSAFSGDKSMRLVTTSPLPTGYETHQRAAELIAVILCRFEKSSNVICYRCQRIAA